MVRIFLDHQTYEVDENKNLLETCLSLGLNLPYFCWHPALGSVGACRQCAVKLFAAAKPVPDCVPKFTQPASDSPGKIVMSCMTPITENLHASVDDPEAKAFRKSVIEWLMINHPHDCPVCDEGGECHLQDMTLMTGHTARRYRFKKRTFQNQDLGPLVNHEMNRCIACYRCVRFYRDYAGGKDLNVFGVHDFVYFGRHEDGKLENELSGNLVEVCPTGVFTDKSSRRHYTRKWDLQTAPSICTHCGLGCNTIPGERYGMLRRIYNRYHPEINGYFICDRGRYGYGFVNSENRNREIWWRPDRKSAFSKTTKEAVLQEIGDWLTPRTIGIGSPRASIEANFALRSLVGAENFYHGMSEPEGRLMATTLDIFHKSPVAPASLRDVELSDAVLILGEDVTQTAPRLALSVRQALKNLPLELSRKLKIPDWQDAAVRDVIQDQQGPLFIAAPYQTKLDEVATQSFYASPDEIARFGYAIAHWISQGKSTSVHSTPGQFPSGQLTPGQLSPGQLSKETQRLAQQIATRLQEAKKPLVISGFGLRSEAILRAASTIVGELANRKSDVQICLTVPEANSVGVGLMGGKPFSEAFKSMANGEVETVIILENDLFRRAQLDPVKAFLSQAKRVILIDSIATAMNPRADVILPSSTFAETDGTFVNNEGRAQRFYQVFVPFQNPGSQVTEIQPAWKWIQDLANLRKETQGTEESPIWPDFDSIVSDIEKSLPVFKGITETAPSASFRIAAGQNTRGVRVSRQPPRYSGRTAILANLTLHEPKPPEDPNSPFSFSMEGFNGEPPAPLLTRYWTPGWNSVQALTKFLPEVFRESRGAGWKVSWGGNWGVIQSPSENVPAPFVPQSDRWLALPIYHIFGSEELSRLSPELAELIPNPYVAIHSDDATRLTDNENDQLEISFDDSGSGSLSLPIRILNTLPRGTIGLPVGLPQLEGRDADLPIQCTVKAKKFGPSYAHSA